MADEPYPLPEEYLGEWKNYSDDVPHSYELRKDGTIVCRPARPETCGDFSPTAYKYIFSDQNGAYVLAHHGHINKNFIFYFFLKPANHYRPLLLEWNDTVCSYSNKIWDHFDKKKLEEDIKAYRKSDTQLWPPPKESCLERSSQFYYQRP